MVVKLIKSSLSFLTPIPLKEGVEPLRRNMWMFPFTAIIIGFIISIPHFLGSSILFLSLLFYIAGEGINHVDGLADFGDALFAPESRKKLALKDTKTGTGGIVAVVIYLLILHTTLPVVNIWQIIFAQVLAKYCMLLLMLLSRPAWEGMASYMMELVGKRDLIVGLLPLLITFYLSGVESVVPLLLSFGAVLWLRNYAHSRFGGINGDLIGASNCTTFALTLVTFTVLHSTWL